MVLKILYTPEFIRSYKKIDTNLQKEIKSRIELFSNKDNHQVLRVYKLHGKFSGNYSFSVNYRLRIIFKYLDNNTVAFISVGNQDIYK